MQLYSQPSRLPWSKVLLVLVGLCLLGGCPLVEAPNQTFRKTAEIRREEANLAAAHTAFEKGHYTKARALFAATQHAQDADLARHALYGLACTQLVAAQTPQEYAEARKLWDSWAELQNPPLKGEDPRLLGKLLANAAPKEPTLISPPLASGKEAGAQAQKLIQAQRRQTEVLEAKLALMEKEIKVLNYFKEYSRNLEEEIRTLRHQIESMQAIDQNIQQKKQEISNQ